MSVLLFFIVFFFDIKYRMMPRYRFLTSLASSYCVTLRFEIYIVDGVASICITGGYFNAVIVVKCEFILMTATQYTLRKRHVTLKKLKIQRNSEPVTIDDIDRCDPSCCGTIGSSNT